MAEMTQEEFMQLQGELEHLELTIAKGERRTTPTLASKNWNV